MIRTVILASVPTFLITSVIYSRTGVEDPLEVRISKPKSIEGEPIGVVVTLRNPGQAELRIIDTYPDFGTWGRLGFRIDAEGEGLVPRRPKDGPPQIIHGFLPIRAIPAGGQYSTTIYLQRFVRQPGPGRYRVPFELTVALDRGSYRNWPSRASGVLVFEVLPADPAALGRVLDRLSEALDCADADCPPQRDAVEALSLVEDPIVIPHLVRMLHTFPLTEKALEALAKFPDHEQARAAVVDVVRSEDSDSAIRADVARALDILAEWRYRLDSRTIDVALGRDLPMVSAAMLDYLERVDPAEQADEIAPSVAGLLDSGDPGVVTRAVGLLARWGAIDEDDARREMTRVETMLVSGDTDLTLRTLKALKEARHKVAPAVLEELLNADEAILRSLARDYVIEFGIRGTSVDAPR